MIAGVSVYTLPAFSQTFIYSRELVISGQIWRLFTGHFVHFTLSHLILNLASIIIIFFLFMKVNIRAKDIINLYLFSGTIISMVLLFFAPDMAFYGGLSSLIISYASYFCLHSIQTKSLPLWLSSGFLFLLTGKLVLELHGASSIVFGSQDNIKVATIAHIAGVIAAIIYWVLTRIKHHIKEQLDIYYTNSLSKQH